MISPRSFPTTARSTLPTAEENSMKLSEKLLSKLAEAPPGRHLLTVTDETPLGWSATITVDRADVVGCVIWELSLQRKGAEPWDAAALTARSEGLARSTTGLLEPLKLLEVDSL